jgi:hypothetical protein
MIFDSKLGGILKYCLATISVEHAALKIIAGMIRVCPNRTWTALVMPARQLAAGAHVFANQPSPDSPLFDRSA